MDNNMTTMAAEPAVAYPMISYKDVTRTYPLFPLKNEVRSNNMDFRYIIPLYTYSAWNGTVAIDEIATGLAELRKNGFMVR